MNKSQLWINGQWAESSGGAMSIENPATGEVIAEVSDASRVGDYQISKHVMIAN